MLSNNIFSTLNQFSNLTQPKDLTCPDDSEAKISFSKNVFKIKTIQKIQNQTQIFKINLNNFDTDQIKMMYLKMYIPPQYSYNVLDTMGYQSLFGLKLVNQIMLKINDVSLENLFCESIFNSIKTMYGDNWDVASKNLGGETNDIYFVDELSANKEENVLLSEQTLLIPLPFSIFLNSNKLKLALLDNSELTIQIIFNSLSSVIIHTSNCKFNEFDGANNVILIEGLSQTDNLIFKNMDYMCEGSSSRPYFVADVYSDISRIKILPFNDYDISFRTGDVANFNLIYKNTVFAQNPPKLFYGFDNQSCINNMLSAFVFSKIIDGAPYLFNLKSGSFVQSNSTVYGKMTVNMLDSNTYELLFKNNNNKLIRTLLTANKPWSSLQDNVFYDFTYFVMNFDFHVNLSIFYFTNVSFSFNSYDPINYLKVPEVFDGPHIKLLGGLFFSSLQNQIIVGITDYTIRNEVNEEFIHLLASNPVDSNIRFNLFSTFNFFKINNIFNNCYDIDGKHKILFNSIDLLNNNTLSTFDNEMLTVYDKSLDNYDSKFEQLSNIFFEFSALNTLGSRHFSHLDSLKTSLYTGQFKNSFSTTFNISDYLKIKMYTFEIILIQKNKRYLTYLNDTLRISKLNQETQKSIVENFLTKKKRAKKSKKIGQLYDLKD